MNPARALLLALSATLTLSCARPSANQSAAAAETPARASMAPAPSPPAAPGDLATTPPQIVIEPESLWLDDQPHPVSDVARLQRIDSLWTALSERRATDPSATPFIHRVAPTAPAALLKSVMHTAAVAGWPVAEYHAAEGLVSLRGGRDESLVWPEFALLIVVRQDSVELWQIPGPRRTGVAQNAPPPSKRIAIVPATADVAAALASVCHNIVCTPVALVTDNAVEFAVIDRVLSGLARAALATRAAAVVEVRLHDPGALAKPRIATTVEGRLAPETIQRIVRENYGSFRRCYEAALARDPKLEGTVVVRFVIGRDGAVSSLEQEPATDMPDPEVVRCVMERYQALRFPPPDGGIVNVVYPVRFAPN